MEGFGAHPGLLYVLATLLPVASFLLILLGGAFRTALRHVPGRTSGAGLYQALGGPNPVRGGAYLAIAAIAGAFICSLIGFILYTNDYSRTFAEEEHTVAARGMDEAEPVAHATDPSKRQEFEERWSGRVDWAWVDPVTASAAHKGTVLTLGYRIDHLTAIMFLMVTFIATLIHIFSYGYMGEELQPIVEDHEVHVDHGHLHRKGRFGRFFLYLSLFCFSMLNLLLADNLFQVFVSWELVGICSYLLVGFYFERRSASNAANKAFITNRVGDAGFIIGLMILWTYVGSFNFEDVFRQVRAPFRDAAGHPTALAGHIVHAQTLPDGRDLRITTSDEGNAAILFPVGATENVHLDEVIHVDPQWQAQHPDAPHYRVIPYWLLVALGLGIFLGCVGKSAQFPLHVWLPDAMEGPTPVSALIHAATMVAAGVYLVGRCFPLFTPEVRLVIAYTGCITLFMAATIAIVVTDIKKVLAYSTVSQLGYMMLALGVGGWVAGLFHLVTHAFFKALLFLCSGSVIYGCHHVQDMSRMGGLYRKMRITGTTMLIGVLTIAGIPLFSGWYSKDAIVAQALGFVRVHPQHLLLFIAPLVTAGITTFYMFRMWLLTFSRPPRDEHVYEHAHETPWVMTVPLMLLAFFSVTVAWGWPIWNAENSVLERQLHHAQHPSILADYGLVGELEHSWEGGAIREIDLRERHYAHEYHGLAGTLAILMVVMGIVFSLALYRFRVLNPEDAVAQFPAIHRFLWNKWYFDEFYSAALVRPALVVANWCRSFDLSVIDGFINWLARFTVHVSDWDRMFDSSIVDGLVNLTARVFYRTGTRLREVQTGYLRSYILFLVLAAVAIFVVLSYFVAGASAG